MSSYLFSHKYSSGKKSADQILQNCFRKKKICKQRSVKRKSQHNVTKKSNAIKCQSTVSCLQYCEHDFFPKKNRMQFCSAWLFLPFFLAKIYLRSLRNFIFRENIFAKFRALRCFLCDIAFCNFFYNFLGCENFEK